MKQILYLSLACIFLASCSDNDSMVESYHTSVNNNHSTFIRQSGASNAKAISSYIHSVLGCGQTRTGEDVEIDLEPYIVEGDTVMFVYNNPEGGFTVFSNDMRVPMILFTSETGFFDLGEVTNSESTFSSEFLNVAEDLSALYSSTISGDSLDGLWDIFYPDDNIIIPGVLDTTYIKDVITLSQILSVNTTTTGHHTTTKWGQGSPWNKYIPFDNTSMQHCLVGCANVAAGQYLYYYKYFNNASYTSYTSATYDGITNSYNFSFPSTSVWNSMANDSVRGNTETVALLLGSIAKDTDTQFGTNVSLTIANNIRDYLNDNRGFNTRFYSYNQRNANIVWQGIQDGEIYIVSGTRNTGTTRAAHMFLLDGAKTSIFKMLCTHNRYLVHIDATGSHTERLIDTYDEIKNDTINYLLMNWGWDGQYNDVASAASLDYGWRPRIDVNYNLNRGVLIPLN